MGLGPGGQRLQDATSSLCLLVNSRLSSLRPCPLLALIETLSSQLPHVRFVGVYLTPSRPLFLFSSPSLFVFFLLFVFLGLVLPERDEGWVQLIQGDGCGVLDVLLQRVPAGLVLLCTAADVDHQQRHDGQSEDGAHHRRHRHATAAGRRRFHGEIRLLGGDVHTGGVDGGGEGG